jgi:hypothetical protein
MWSGGIVAALIAMDRSGLSLLAMPAFWYRSRSLHLLICISFFVVGILLLRHQTLTSIVTETASDKPNEKQPLFDSVRFFSRVNCPLCDEAMDLLEEYSCWMPEIEFVNIADNPLLEEQHGESIPVVEIDGQIRFRGRIDRVLLQRLIDSRRRGRGAGHSEQGHLS